MILERLIELRQRLEDDPDANLPPAYHKRQKIRWIMEITRDGKFAGIVESGRTKKEQKEFDTPVAKRSGTKPQPFLLADKRVLVIGPTSDSGSDSASTAHRVYIDLAVECANAVDAASLQAFIMFLASDSEKAKARTEADTRAIEDNEVILPRVDGIILTSLQGVRAFWKESQDKASADKVGLDSECMTCGKQTTICRIHPHKIPVAKGVDLVSGNQSAIESYGLQKAEIAPMCLSCARSYAESLTWLLQNEAHNLRSGDVTWAFWTRSNTTFNLPKLLSDPAPEDVRRLLRAPFTGNMPNLDQDDFYALGMSANVSRLIVRNWLMVSLAKAKENLLAYFDRQKVIGGRDGADAPLKLMALAGATVRDLKDLPPQVVPALIDSALTGGPLPLWLLQQAVTRARAERDHVMTRPRAALIKMVLLSQPHSQEDIMPSLNPDHPHPAYHCGRLLALLDDVQRNAVGARATLIDRYYGAASTTPAVVFGALMRNAQNHLSKLRKTRLGLYIHFDRSIAEITSHIEEFPTTLTLREQGLFALGFYQQKNRPRAEESAEAVEDNGATAQVA